MLNNKCLFLIGSVLFVGCYGNKQEKVRKPNIIYILADDLGRADIGCFGQEKIETPNIDRLAQEGMCFTNHYSGQAVSAPSRCSLFTGLHMQDIRPLVSASGVWGIQVLSVRLTRWDLISSMATIVNVRLTLISRLSCGVMSSVNIWTTIS